MNPLKQGYVPPGTRNVTSGNTTYVGALPGQKDPVYTPPPRNDNGSIIAPNSTNSPMVAEYNYLQSQGTRPDSRYGASLQALGDQQKAYGYTNPFPTQNPFPPQNPGGGGGGRGYAPAGIDQGTFDSIMKMIGGYTPEKYEYIDINTPEYAGTGFRDWDGSGYDTARQGMDTGFSDARLQGTTAFDLADQSLASYQNPYRQGMQQRTPGASQALQNSMNAWGGAGQDAANQESQFGFRQDQGMDSMYDLLGASEDSYTQGLQRGIAGDRMQLDQRLSAEQRMMSLDLDMRQQKAKARYDQEKWQYGEDIALMNYQTEMSNAQANNAGQNQAGQANTGMANENSASNQKTIIDLILAGIDGSGSQTLTDLTGGGAYPTI